jgi:uncharacterized protein
VNRQAQFDGGGVVDLLPKLRFGLLETGCGWLPYWMERLDEMHDRGEKDPPAIAACGDKCIMYASDYPHGDSKWPETVSRIRAAGFSETTETRILGENAARLYKLGVPLG